MARADLAEGEAGVATPGETGDEDHGEASIDSDAFIDSSSGNLLDGAGSQSGDAGDSTIDAAVSDATHWPDVAVGIGPNDADTPNEEGGCVGAACVVDACHPNPCGHGACVLTASSFSCKCDPDWRGDNSGGFCNVNTSAALSGLAVSSGKLFPAFKSNVYEYSVDLGVGSPEITLVATARQPDGVVMRIDGESYASGSASPVLRIDLNSQGKATVEVLAHDGTTARYSVVLRRTLALQAELSFPGAQVGASRLQSNGHGLALSGNLLATLQTHGDGSTNIALHSRTGSSWTWQAYLPKPASGAYRSVSLNRLWLAAGAWSTATPMAGLVSVIDRAQLPYRAEPITLQPPTPEDKFGLDVAVYGDTVAVLSTTRVHIYERGDGTWKHVALFDVAGDVVALGDNALAVAGGLNAGPGPIRFYRRAGAKWEAAADLDGTTDGMTAVALAMSGTSFATAEPYACFLSCTGTAPDLHIVETLGTERSHATVRPPFGADVARPLDPNGFGLGVGLSENVALAGAVFEGSMRVGVNTAPPNVSQLPDEAGLGLGVAYVATRQGTNWKIEAVLGPTLHSDANGQPFGFGSAIQVDRGTIAVAAPDWAGRGEPEGAGGGGAIYVFGPDCSKLPAGAEVDGC